ncbi:MAG: GIY-YIG nuclease family protein [Pseudomonadota bacterium]|uniref:GIY-YIG nuclease family protein n=1 Tax=Sphingobium sp. TaxID=1912891 RepID=UPI002E2471D8
MDFYACLLRCSDGSFYAGHTDNLDLRIAAREQGESSGYTAPRRHIALVWSESFGTRDEALAAERRIKGWSRTKKQALVEGNWERIKVLARNRQTGG